MATRWILWTRKQSVPEQCGTGMYQCQEAGNKSLNVQITTPNLPPWLREAWHITPLRLLLPGYGPHPQVSGYSQGMQTLAPDPAWPGIPFRTCPIHLGPSEQDRAGRSCSHHCWSKQPWLGGLQTPARPPSEFWKVALNLRDRLSRRPVMLQAERTRP